MRELRVVVALGKLSRPDRHLGTKLTKQACLGGVQRKDLLDKLAMQEGPPPKGQRKRHSVRIDEGFQIQCRRCTEQPDCFVCEKPDLPPVETKERAGGKGDIAKGEDVDMEANEAANEAEDELRSTLRFRCLRCKQGAHYEHRELAHSSGLGATAD